MAPKAIYAVIAVIGIAAASGVAWWYQQPKSGGAGIPGSTSTTGAAPLTGAGGNQASAANPASPASAAPGARPPSVEVAKVEAVKLTDETQAVGSLRSRRGVVVRPEVSGRITQLNFVDGQRVRKGQVLVQFDDQLQQAQVQQALAELSIAQANQKRNQELVAQNFVSRRSLDESAANLQVAQAKLSLAIATAARLKIIAPFDGIAGIRVVNVGDYLRDGADIVNIEDIDAIFVDFRLPERFQAKVKRGQTAMVDLDALPGRKFTAQIQAIDPLIDANGRSVGVRGCIDNRQLQLRPGMFARVNAVFGVREDARVIPEEAIVPQGGKQFVIKLIKSADGKTQTSQRVEVKLGLRTPGKVEILDGLALGDMVAITGQQRVQRDGTTVNVVDMSSARSGRPGGPGGPAAPGSSNQATLPSPTGAASSAQPAASAASGGPVVAPSAAAATSPAVAKTTVESKPAVVAMKPPAKPSGLNPCMEQTASERPSGKPATGKPPSGRPA